MRNAERRGLTAVSQQSRQSFTLTLHVVQEMLMTGLVTLCQVQDRAGFGEGHDNDDNFQRMDLQLAEVKVSRRVEVVQ